MGAIASMAAPLRSASLISPARAGTPEAMAREFLSARHAQLGLSASQSAALVRTTQRAGRHFSVVRFEQRQQGLPVYGSDIAVSVMPNGRVVYVANSAVAGVAAVDTTANKTDLDATAIAKQYLGVSGASQQKAERMVYVDAGASHLVWRVTVVAQDALRGEWELLVDAQSGEVLRAQDISAYDTGTGTIHTPDPLSYARVAYNTPGYVDGNNADTPQLTAALVPVTLDDITLSGGNYTLSGPYAVCEDWDTPHDAGCPSQPGSDFSVTRSALTFDAVMGLLAHQLLSQIRQRNARRAGDAAASRRWRALRSARFPGRRQFAVRVQLGKADLRRRRRRRCAGRRRPDPRTRPCDPLLRHRRPPVADRRSFRRRRRLQRRRLEPRLPEPVDAGRHGLLLDLQLGRPQPVLAGSRAQLRADAYVRGEPQPGNPHRRPVLVLVQPARARRARRSDLR